MNIKYNNKDIKIFKEELWTRRINTEAEIIVLRGNQVVKETTLLDKIRKNYTREQEVWKELEKQDRQA